MKTVVEISQYKGHDIFSVVESGDAQYPKRVSLGLAKAKMLLDNIKALKEFVKNNEKKATDE